jgi:hypothetical protein
MADCISCFYVDQKEEMERMMKMLGYFHPEVTIEAMNYKDLQRIGITDLAFSYSKIGRALYNQYNTITHIDADVLIVDKLDELFDDSTDARAGRCNSDTNLAGTNIGFAWDGIPWQKYLNSGIHSITGQVFWDAWYAADVDHITSAPLGENGTFNQIFYSGKFRTTLLDPIEQPVHYGTSCQYGTKTHWDSWKEIKVINDHLEINNKRIKMLHIAGGGTHKPELNTLFNPDVLDFINIIIKG